MSPGTPLPALSVSDFGPGQDHVAEAYQNGRVFAILHKSDLARAFLPNVYLAPDDPWTYVFVHGGEEVSRFENLVNGTHEVPDHVVAALLAGYFGAGLDGMQVRMCTCYGNMRRPGESRTAVQALAGLLPRTHFEGYHGLVFIDPNVTPPKVILGDSLAWDALSGAYVIGPPGGWEPVLP